MGEDSTGFDVTCFKEAIHSKNTTSEERDGWNDVGYKDAVRYMAPHILGTLNNEDNSSRGSLGSENGDAPPIQPPITGRQNDTASDTDFRNETVNKLREREETNSTLYVPLSEKSKFTLRGRVKK